MEKSDVSKILKEFFDQWLMFSDDFIRNISTSQYLYICSRSFSASISESIDVKSNSFILITDMPC
jgi:hypothetical protein